MRAQVRRVSALVAVLTAFALTPLLPLPFCSPASAQIISSASLHVERAGHSATRLQDGHVLIVGGENAGGVLSSAEIYDPAAQLFALTGSLVVPRTEHTATLLAGGRVLITGGRQDAPQGRGGQPTPLASTEVFDPMTGSFSIGPSLTSPRSGHTATALGDGRILIAGGDAQGSAEIFDPTIFTFTALAVPLTAPRWFAGTALLQDGTVLIAGGADASGSGLQSAEIFSLGTSSFAAVQSPLAASREDPLLRVLPDGKVLIIGGSDDSTVELFDPAGPIIRAYARVLNVSNTLADVLRSRTRTALIHLLDPNDPLLRIQLTPVIRVLLDRTGYSLTEMPDRNQALVAGGANRGGRFLRSADIVGSSSAAITTDRSDYARGSRVDISGTNWEPGEIVLVTIHEERRGQGRPGASDPDVVYLAVADHAGRFINRQFSLDRRDVGRTFMVTAVGETSGFVAQTSFSDASCTTVWSGTVSSDWNNGNNWSNGVPNGNTDVCIDQANGPNNFQPVITTAAQARQLNLCTGATGSCNAVIESLTISAGGSLTVGSTFLMKGGTFNMGAGTVTLTGANLDLQGSPTINPGTSTLVFARGAQQLITSGNNSVTTVTVSNVTVNSGTAFNFGNSVNSLAIKGNLTVNGSWNTGGTVTFNGTTGGQTLGGTSGPVFNNLTISNSSGVTLGVSPSIQSTLQFTSGTITTGSSAVIANSGVSGAGQATGFVNGNLRKPLGTGGQSKTFEVGSAGNYSPINLTFTNVTTGGTLTARTTAGDHPQIAGSGIDSTKSVNRYWTLTNGGIVYSSAGYGATFNFQSSDVDTGANTSHFIVKRYSGGWASTTAGARTGKSTQATVTALSAFGDFAVGDPRPADMTITKTHTGSFSQGQTGATYTITATNSGGGATSGTVTAADTLPSGLTATAMSGSGWSCTLSPLQCTRSDALAAGSSYPAISLTVNVATNAPSSVINTATVSGGGETNTSNDTANDTTTITQVASAGNSTVSANLTSVAADGTTTSTITVTLKDGSNNPVSGKTVTLTAGGGSSTISAASGPSNSSGVVTFTVKDTRAEAVTYTARDTADNVTVTQAAAVRFTPGNASKLAFGQQPASTMAAAAITPAVTVLVQDANGNTVTSSSASITMAIGSNPGTGTLGGTLTVSASSGVATFSTLSINKTGTGYTLTASSPGLTGTTSNGFTVALGSVSASVSTISANPAWVTADGTTTSTITVTLTDSGGNPASGKTVTLAKSGGSSTITTVSGTTNAGGQASFTVTDTVTESTAYTATDTTDGNLTITQTATVTFTAAPAAKLVFGQQPTGTAAGAAITPAVTVQVLDGNNNLVTTSTASITVAIGTNPGGGTLSGTATVAASGGIATFSTLSIEKAGSGYTLAASSTGLTGATSGSFSVNAGALDRVTIGPASATIDAGGSQSYTASAFDAFDNNVGDVTASTAVTIAPDGSCTTNSCTATVAGAHTVTGTYGGKTATAGLQVNAGALDHLVLSPGTASITAGQSQAYTAEGFDQYGNSGGDVTGATTFSISPNGSCTGASCTATGAGAHTVTGTDGTAVGSLTLQVGGGTLDTFLVETVGGGPVPPQTAGTAFGIRITARDQYNNTATGFSGTVQITSNGVLEGSPLTSEVFTAGILASQSVTIDSSGTGTTVTATASGTSGTSNGFTVNAAGATSFLVEAAVGGNIGPQTAGAPFAIRTTARDQFHNTVTDFAGPVTLTTNAGTVTPGSAVFTGAEGGVLTVSDVEVTLAGTNAHITATAGAGSGTSNDFTVNAGGIGGFLIETPGGGDIGPQTAGTAFSVQITARDSFNNPVPSFTGVVDLTTTAGAIAPTSVTFVAGDTGVHVESVTVTQAGTDKTVTATSLTDTGTSNAFTVNGGALDHLVLNPATATITAGGSQSYTAQGQDQSNNGLGDVTASTTFTISPDGSCTGASCTATVAGGHTVTGTSGGKTGTASLTVTAAALDHLVLSPTTATITAGQSQAYTVQGRDPSNNSLGDVTGATAFSIAPDGSCTGATCTATVAGAHRVTGTSAGKTGTAALTVNAVALNHLVLSPTTATITAGVSQIYTAEEFDSSDTSLGDVTVGTTFTISPDGSCTGNACAAIIAGAHTVSGAHGSATGTASLLVASAAPDFALSAAPAQASMLPGGQLGYSISVSGTGGFADLVALSVTGLPTGVSGTFTPASLGPGQSGPLTLQVGAGSPIGTASFSVTGTATIDGAPRSHTLSLAIEVLAGGRTALIGRVVNTDEMPLPGVVITVADKTASTDMGGNFLLLDPPAGEQVALIDGGPAGTPTAQYPTIPASVTIVVGQVNALPYLPHLHAQKTSNFTLIDPAQETVATDPDLPGVALRIPAGVQIIGWDGQPNTMVSIRTVPIDRLPVRPLPPSVRARTIYMFYFGKQGGGIPSRPVPFEAPNDLGLAPGATAELWYFDESPIPGEAPNDWRMAGTGTVSPDGRTIVTDPGVGIPKFCCGSVTFAPGSVPSQFSKLGSQATDGEPVDLGTGLFVVSKTDLVLPDVFPLSLTRTYRPGDPVARPFGIGTSHPWTIFLWSSQPFQQVDLILPDGARVHYARISPGTGFSDAVFEHTATPSRFYKSRLAWNGGWDLTLTDGTRYHFLDSGQLQSLQDRHGNTVVLTRAGNITRVTSPSGRWFQFSYDVSNRITRAQDSLGRVVTYTYDAQGRLATVTDPEGGVTRYTYDAAHRMLTLTDARGILYLTNEYNGGGRVIRQTQADATTYQFAYTLDGSGRVTQTDVTDPRGSVRRVTFNADGYALSDTRALGRPEQQSLTYDRQPGSNVVLATTDALGRRTASTYDALGNLTSLTRLAGTAGTVTTTLTYEPTFNQVTSLTDPLGRTTALGRDSHGNLTTITDPLGQQTTFTYNAAGQPLTITDAAGTTQFAYALGILASVTDPLGNTTTRVTDSAGRPVSVSNPLGQQTQYVYDGLNRLTQVADPRGGGTGFGYDPNGNLLSVTDARGSVTGYGYDSMDRAVSRTDPLQRTESYGRDANGNVTSLTDRKGQPTATTYDALNRRTEVTFADGSTISYTWDAGNRLTQVADSLAGTITRSYDLLDRLTEEGTPQGTVSYTYDAVGRRTSMTASGQSPVVYAYDAANRLTQITQGSATVSVSYDGAGRRTALSLPNGLVTAYTYDAASRLTALTYTHGATVLGTLTYGYDAAGNRTQVGGTWARTGLPGAVASATYDAANQQVTFGGLALTYDATGNLASDGTNTYTWNARNQLVGITGAGVTASFSYDGLGRRQGKTINGTSTHFLYDGLNPVQEIGTTGTARLLTGLGIDEYLVRTEVTGTRTLLTDALGSTVALTDEAGALQSEYAYEPFGATAETGADSNSLQYTGRENDGTGLYYFRARYYHPVMQRFISEDPLGIAGGDANLHSYAHNSPLKMIDPLGLYVVEIEGEPDCMDLGGRKGCAARLPPLYVDATDWGNTTGGRSRWDGPTNGNWGGKCWSGGQYSCRPGGQMGNAPPLDSGDEAYKRHDTCYATSGNSSQLMANCDRALVDELRALPDDSRRWPRPPRLGTEGDSERYRIRAINFFRR